LGTRTRVRRRGRFPLAAGDRAVDGAPPGQEGPAQQGAAAGAAAEALVRRMPMLPVVAHLALVHPNHLPAVVAVLGEHRVEAGQTVRFALAHDVPLAAQLVLALLAGEVLHVPRPTLRLRALVREDDLV